MALIKTIIKRLYREWKLFGLDNIAVSRTQASFNIQANIPVIVSDAEINITINVMISALSGQQSLCIVLDAIFPKQLPSATSMPSVYAFTQFASALIAPFFLIVDLESHHLIIRQSQIISTDVYFKSTPFLLSLQRLIPLLYNSIHCLDDRLSPDDARGIASHLCKDFYGEMTK